MAINVKDAIAARHSVRAFTKEKLTGAEIAELLEAARNAPSSLNSQPWRFKVVTDAADLAWFGTSEATRKQAWLCDAAAIVVCCVDLAHYVKDSQAAAFYFKENKIIEGEPMEGIEAYVAREEQSPELAKFAACAMNLSIAVSFMMLRAVDMGLGTCWIGMLDEANIKARFGLAATQRVVCLLAVGHPDEKSAAPRIRKTLDEIVLK